jgi:SAM-dependent methyltransferase
MHPQVKLVCPEHQAMLSLDGPAACYRCPEGCRFPIHNGIPRFVPSTNYADSFGLQWNTFRRTQLDSYTRTTLSRDRLARIAGGSLDAFAEQSVLEAGCGAGRFTEVMLGAGATVFAADISSAVEANRENCGDSERYFVCQADITRLPVQKEQFDVVVCVGVIQHTPDPERTMSALCSYVKPGGRLFIDHYPPNYPVGLARSLLRRHLLGRSSREALEFCTRLIDRLWPLHRFMWKVFRESPLRHVPLLPKLRSVFLRLSPVVDYHDAYLTLGPELLKTWALLDTHDTLTDVYKHLRSKEQIADTLRQLGMVDIHASLGGNGVEARARKAPI